jgi:hypothetical protein
MAVPGKPTAAELGVDLGTLAWRGPGGQLGAIQVAFVTARGADWVLLRVLGDDEGLISVFSHHEWECFLDGAKKGEFDAAARLPGPSSRP